MKKIYEILAEIKPEHNFKTSNNFIDDGLLDSFDIISLISMLEETYEVIIDGMDIIPENFDTVQSIENLINRSKKTDGGKEV